MSRPRRIAVTAPAAPTGAARGPARPAGDPPPDPAVLDTARRVRRAQLRRATTTVLLGALLLFGLPVLLRFAPDLGGLRLFGVPGGWLAVALAPYPLLAGLAWCQLAAAERAERDTGDEVERAR